MAGGSDQDWYLKDWMRHFGKKQAALVNELGWDKAKANFLFHSKQPYRRDVVNQIAGWLGIRTFELLMPPAEALALRRLRETAALIVAEEAAVFDHTLASGRTGDDKPSIDQRSPGSKRTTG